MKSSRANKTLARAIEINKRACSCRWDSNTANEPERERGRERGRERKRSPAVLSLRRSANALGSKPWQA